MVAPLLAPVITMLLSKGLGLLGNAVIAKGKDAAIANLSSRRENR